jgi:adenosylcobinamide-GDP ribazoletransferase
VRGRPGDPAVSGLADGWRLAVGTLTVLPTRPPRRVDGATAASAMTVAPVVGLLLGVPAVLLVGVLHADRPPLVPGSQASRFLVAALVIGLLALLTRGMHLDGLADTADGLGSGKAPDAALAVMRRSDIGPFGVITLVLVLLVQVAALAQLLGRGFGTPALLVALTVSRLTLPLACSRGIPAARPEGLGHLVAGSVGRGRLVLSAVTAVAALSGALLVAAAVWPDATAGLPDATAGLPAPVDGALVAASRYGLGWFLIGLGATVVVPLGVTALFLRRCLRRFGGITGDVLGACVEVSFTSALLVSCLL